MDHHSQTDYLGPITDRRREAEQSCTTEDAAGEGFAICGNTAEAEAKQLFQTAREIVQASVNLDSFIPIA
jgi:hypothetical protein